MDESCAPIDGWKLCPWMDDLVEVGPSWVSWWYGLKQRWDARERERERLTSKQSPSSMRTQQQHHLPIRVFHCHCIFFIDIVSGWSTITSEGAREGREGIEDWRLQVGIASGEMTQEEKEEEVRRELWSARSGREMASSSSTSIRMRWTASVRGDDGASATRSSDSTKSPVTTCTNLKTAFHDCFNRSVCLVTSCHFVLLLLPEVEDWVSFLMVNDVDGVFFLHLKFTNTRWPSVENVS